ncbi:signal transduction histidine kinase [Allocatelliglobosispora scoriae]|uniref:Signal transduction histidine kinase n=1 Tax=Allocatelliglobosispora scoriae TaxID=643052 RepID=A0A841BRA2_9ACTN|nr:GAF domain-containing sensor histidine kinase [Allocatelliglobosispora scoriae]MBB5869443.1 signal transduction histidine kinase [Allocatelliglobosispora scoriae]
MVRLALLTLVAALTVLVAGVGQLVWIGALAVAGLPTLFMPRHRVIAPLGRLAEVLLIAVGASYIAGAAVDAGTFTSGVGAGALLPYLAVPLTAAAFYGHRFEAGALLLAATIGLGTAGAFIHVDGVRLIDSPGYLAICAQWLVLVTLGTLTSGALQRAVLARRSVPQPYAEATRLLTQLRTVARQLPGATLDPGGIAEHLIDEVRTVTKSDRAAVLTASGGGRLMVLAQSGLGLDGSDRSDWETTLDTDSAIAEAWASQLSQISSRSQTIRRTAAAPGTSSEVSALVVPLVAGVRTVGLLVLELDAAGGFPPNAAARLRSVADPAALRLEAALLFDEVRSLATNEERQRLAREIHDGVAQELVMVGYGIDNALATLPEEGSETTETELRALRAEVTRVITELRLSLFELRSEVERHGGLTAAIAEFARIVGASAGLRVHLSLDDSPARLPAATEAELLRIAQEAITNARKHAGATNLWVTCSVDPPNAQIEVSDDGQGIADQRVDGHYGIAIMKERAERIRGRLEIRPRHPHGTTVAVVLGSSGRRDNV